MKTKKLNRGLVLGAALLVGLAGYVTFDYFNFKSNKDDIKSAVESYLDEAAKASITQDGDCREALEKAGMMPECFFLYYEELDWSLMISRAGYEIWYEPACTIYHKESQATGQNSPLKTFYLMRNRLLLAKRNIPIMTRFLTYSYLIGIVGTKDIITNIIKGCPQQAKATLRGIVDFLKL